jgi:hypothetical protein
MIVAKAMRNRSPLDGSGEWFGCLGWHEQNALNNSVSHTQHSRHQKGIPKINSHPKSQGFSPNKHKTLQRRFFFALIRDENLSDAGETATGGRSCVNSARPWV